MKTTEKLFNKHKLGTIIQYDSTELDIMECSDFSDALTEHDNEIKQLIDEFYDVAIDCIEMVGSANYQHIEEEAKAKLDKALTELKSKI